MATKAAGATLELIDAWQTLFERWSTAFAPTKSWEEETTQRLQDLTSQLAKAALNLGMDAAPFDTLLESMGSSTLWHDARQAALDLKIQIQRAGDNEVIRANDLRIFPKGLDGINETMQLLICAIDARFDPTTGKPSLQRITEDFLSNHNKNTDSANSLLARLRTLKNEGRVANHIGRAND